MRQIFPTTRVLVDGDLESLYDPGEGPSVRGGFVTSVDGGIAVAGRSAGLQTKSDHAVFSALRGVADAVLVGAGTVRTENYGPVVPSPTATAWRRRHGRDPHVPLVIVSRRLDVDPVARCFQERPYVVTCAASDPATRAALGHVAEVLVHGHDEVDLAHALRDLEERSLGRVLCEGGPTLMSALHLSGLLDELCLTTTPFLVGAAPTMLAAPAAVPAPLRLMSLVDGGDGALLSRWAVVRQTS